MQYLNDFIKNTKDRTRIIWLVIVFSVLVGGCTPVSMEQPNRDDTDVGTQIATEVAQSSEGDSAAVQSPTDTNLLHISIDEHMDPIIKGICRDEDTVLPAHRDQELEFASRETVKVFLLGDTGDPEGDYPKQYKTLLKSVAKEANKDNDIVAALGDLIYNRGPRCKDGHVKNEALTDLTKLIGEPLGSLDVPVLLTVGNHDITKNRLLISCADPSREACYLDFAAQYNNLYLPALDYSIDLGVATIAVINSNSYNLTERTAQLVKDAFDSHTGWKILLAHHGLVIYHDKTGEDELRTWLENYDIRPHLIGNGHAHLLQFGIYDEIMAVTSGATTKLRLRDECQKSDPKKKEGCGEGQLWGLSELGYAVLNIAQEELEVEFKNINGERLWGCFSIWGTAECIENKTQDN